MVQYPSLDATFAALSDPTRRGILQDLRAGPASISDLAARYRMTPTGITKHVRLLEEAGLVVTEKKGRVRHCRLGTNRLEHEADWIRDHQQMIEGRMDRLAEFLDRTKGKS
ncbi:ArsR/SmtB family transcription factor [Rhodococcus rhodochrous]|uniref:Transcriptional regulator n=1 Tax=Rhodococcus rhodochrous KG-21 TaxID=1441923 RepID=A0A0M8PNG6_RHORH|nr:metalloregulator ArsR/SmtB family transcription factor [Rhodococcus rhodochrous]KOS55308.1 transcriptional regulator [Rhodococcus rhodochrous KG-21]